MLAENHAGILGVGFKRYGSEELLVKDPIRHLFDVYVKINSVIKEEKEAEAEKLGLPADAKLVFLGL
jgi:arginyl-tRNA synthetase